MTNKLLWTKMYFNLNYENKEFSEDEDNTEDREAC